MPAGVPWWVCSSCYHGGYARLATMVGVTVPRTMVGVTVPRTMVGVVPPAHGGCSTSCPWWVMYLLYMHPGTMVGWYSSCIYTTLPPWVYHQSPMVRCCIRCHRYGGVEDALGSVLKKPLGESLF